MPDPQYTGLMGLDPDQLERDILDLLGEEDSMTFTQIEEALGSGEVTSPRVSRRLKHLIKLGRIQRRVTDSWPPRAYYTLSPGRTKPLMASIPEGKEATKPDGQRVLSRSFWLMTILMVFITLPAWLYAAGFLSPGLGFLLVPSILAGLYAGLATKSFPSSLLLCLSTSLVALAVRGAIGLAMLVPVLIADDMYLASKLAGEQLRDTLMMTSTVLPLLLLGSIPAAAVRELHGDTLKKIYLATLKKNREPSNTK